MDAVSVCNISKKFQAKDKTVWALKEINLNIRKGTIFSLLGPNGAGKSTLLNIMTNVLTPTSGTVYLLGKEVQKNPALLERTGYMSSETFFHWVLTPYDVLQVYGRLYGVPAARRRKRIKELVRQFALDRILHRQMSYLSTGERARTALAKTLIHDPEIVLLDEPTSGLDPDMARRVRQGIRQMARQGKTVILTSHNMQEVEQLSDEVAFIYQGRIVDQGKISAVKLRHFNTYDAIFTVRSVRGKAGLEKSGFTVSRGQLRRTLDQDEDISRWLKLLHQQGMEVTNVEMRKPSLEDYFVKIVRGKGRAREKESQGE